MSTRKQDGTILDSPSRTQLIELFPAETPSVAADSHPGFQRENNEDSFGTSVVPGGATLLFVADGIGGNSGGDLASQFATKSLLAQWKRFTADGGMPGADAAVSFFRNALEDINRTVYGINADQGTLSMPMGTTIAAVALLSAQIVVAHAGDSRVYRVRANRLESLTEDHSMVQKWVRDGLLAPEDAATHPMSHVIYKSIGQQRTLEPDIRIFDRKPGDRFIVCSDGLMCHVSDPEILDVVTRAASAQNAVQSLITLALKRGGYDNVTVACCIQP